MQSNLVTLQGDFDLFYVIKSTLLQHLLHHVNGMGAVESLRIRGDAIPRR
jgi:hypothetical protein